MRKGKSLRRIRKKARTSGMARYADQTPRSERMWSQPCKGVQSPQYQRAGKLDVSKSWLTRSTSVTPLIGTVAGSVIVSLSRRTLAPTGLISSTGPGGGPFLEAVVGQPDQPRPVEPDGEQVAVGLGLVRAG